MVGRSDAIHKVLDMVAQVAPVDISVLVTGESGTGKELVAKALHQNSKRAQNPLVTVNCGAIPEGIIESELFGHKKVLIPMPEAIERDILNPPIKELFFLMKLEKHH
jgi:two-component system response regulator HydG